MKINWKVRRKNINFIIQIIASILLPIITYAGLTVQDLTSWTILGDVLIDAVSNPYVLGMVALSAYNAITDPTTAGYKDSIKAMTYDKPRKDVA